MIFASDYMCNRHQMIVDHHRKVIGGHAVGTNNNEIADGLAFKPDRPPDQIVEFDAGLRNFKPVGWFSSLCGQRFTFGIGKISALPHIARHAFA